MARPTKNKEVTQFDVPEIKAEVMEAANTASMVDSLLMDSSDLLQQTGQIQAFDFLRRVADLSIAKIFENIKESKGYRNMPYKDSDGNLRHVADLEEFCKVFLGKSYRRCVELSQNLSLLGEELYEQSEKIGLSARDYAAIKKAPPEKLEEVKAAIEQEDKTKVKEIIEDLAASYVRKTDALEKEKEALQKKVDDLSATADAKEKIIETKERLNRKLQEDFAKLQTRIKTTTPDQELKQLRSELEVYLLQIESTLHQSVQSGIDLLIEKGDIHFLHASLGRLNGIVTAFVQNLPVLNPEELDEWMKD